MPLLQLAFRLGKTVDELEECDSYWINRMLMVMGAEAEADRIGTAAG
jgi:hypothetical protein